MGLLNGTDDFKKYLKDEIIQLGDSLATDAVVNFEVEWLGNESDIEHCYGSCSCTDGYFEDNKVKGTLNIARSNYDRETGVVNQFVFIYIKDGQDFYLADSKKRRISNPSKNWIRLSLVGKVLLP